MAARRMFCALIAGLLMTGCHTRSLERHLVDRWVFVQSNLSTDENCRQVESLLQRAHAAGYNGIVLSDRLTVLDHLDARYRRNIDRIDTTAKKLGLDLYPAVCPVGYANSLLRYDPNLAEGLPVQDARFVVRGRQADVAADPPVQLNGSDFEAAQNNTFAGWDLQDAPGSVTFADREIHHGGGQSLRMEGIGQADPRHGQARVRQTVLVSPFRQYHLSVWIKTQAFETPENVRSEILGHGGRALAYNTWNIQKTQGWTQYHTVFNSLDNRQVQIYLGVWEGKSGAIWWDDVALEEVGLLNVLRRDGCPLTVRGEDGTVYEEGRDYLPVRDPRLVTSPHTGNYEVYHMPPVLRLTANSRLRDGQRLRLSFYHNLILHEGQVPCCLSEPKVYDLLRDQIVRANQRLHPRGFFLSHDEVRIANWCQTCRKRNLTPGQILADNLRRCVAMVRQVSPNARVFVWSDMFDPYHNAHDDYFLVNGTWAGSWEGLPRDVVVVNWNFNKRQQSLSWFAGRGNAQVLAGYRDGAPERIRAWLEDSSSVPRVTGVMFTTWRGRYANLEAFAQTAWGR